MNIFKSIKESTKKAAKAVSSYAKEHPYKTAAIVGGTILAAIAAPFAAIYAGSAITAGVGIKVAAAAIAVVASYGVAAAASGLGYLSTKIFGKKGPSISRPNQVVFKKSNPHAQLAAQIASEKGLKDAAENNATNGVGEDKAANKFHKQMVNQAARDALKAQQQKLAAQAQDKKAEHSHSPVATSDNSPAPTA